MNHDLILYSFFCILHILWLIQNLVELKGEPDLTMILYKAYTQNRRVLIDFFSKDAESLFSMEYGIHLFDKRCARVRRPNC